MSIVVTIVSFSVLIILHELGHYGVARAFGMRVLRFSLGFGPALLRWRFGETEWQLAAIPMGGYVQIDGMGPRVAAEGESAADVPEDPRGFRSKPVWQRFLVLFAGPAVNWLLGALFIVVAVATVGIDRIDAESTRVGEVLPELPAAQAGLREGDRVLSIDGAPVARWVDLVEHISGAPGRPLAFLVERGAEQLTLSIVPRDDDGVGRIGIGPHRETLRLSIGPALAFGATWAVEATVNQLVGLGTYLSGGGGDLAGPVGVVRGIASEAGRGARRLLEALAWFSVGLCIVNLLPLPTLDGGRLIFLTLESIRGRPVDQKLEAIVHAVGFLLIIALILALTVGDVVG